MILIEMDRIYKNIPLEEIPWNIEAPPDALVELVNSGKVKPCKTIDMGCGAGNYAAYLASKGFDVTGIDISPSAIKIAKENAKKKGVKGNFLVADVLGDLDEVRETFDFAMTGSCYIIYSPTKGENMFKMCIKY